MYSKLLLVIAIINVVNGMQFRLKDLADRNKGGCEKVKVDICRNNVHSNYNSTRFPNRFHHETQEEANQIISMFKPLIQIGCSDSLAPFLCSLYVPVCSPSLNKPLQPCRSLCEQSKQGCEPLMSKFAYKWQFNCNEFPADGTELCVGADFVKKQKPKATKTIKKKSVWNLINEHAAVNIVCEPNKRIFIRKIKQKNSSCCPVATKSVLSAMCNGKRTCIIANTASTLGGHCQDKIGDLWIRYKCISKNKALDCSNHTA